jgi:hypothetical protein
MFVFRFGSVFDVRVQSSGMVGLEHRTPNPEPGTEREHEQRSENLEV